MEGKLSLICQTTLFWMYFWFGNLLKTLSGQALWSTWTEWLWEVYSPYSNRLQGTPNS